MTKNLEKYSKLQWTQEVKNQSNSVRKLPQITQGGR